MLLVPSGMEGPASLSLTSPENRSPGSSGTWFGINVCRIHFFRPGDQAPACRLRIWLPGNLLDLLVAALGSLSCTFQSAPYLLSFTVSPPARMPL